MLQCCQAIHAWHSIHQTISAGKSVSVLKMACSSTTFSDGNVKTTAYFLLQNILLRFSAPG